MSRIRRSTSALVSLSLATALPVVWLATAPAATATDSPDGVGERKAYTFESQRLDDRLELKVNPATGNLLLSATDLRIAGTGLDLEVKRTYNSLDTSATTLGTGWRLGVGQDVHLDVSSSAVVFHAPTGYETSFDVQADGSYRAAADPGIDAKLTKKSDGSFVLEWNSKEKYLFSSAGRWTSREDKNGNRITFAYGSGQGAPVATVTDTRGRTVSFAYSKGKLTSVTDNAAGRVYTYTYDTAGRLASSAVTADALERDNLNIGLRTTYGYDASDRLVSVTDPRGKTTQVGYVGTSRKVASVTRATGPRTTFSYPASLDRCAGEDGAVREAVVDGPRSDVSDVTTYCFDDQDRKVVVVDAKDHERHSDYTSNSNVSQLNESGVAGGPGIDFQWQDDNLTQVKLPTGGQASMEYGDPSNAHLPTDVRDFSASGTDAPPTWSYDYDDDGNLVEARNAAEDITFRYCVNADGTVDRIAPGPLDGLPLDENTSGSSCQGQAQGNDTLFTYNSRGELTRVDPPGGRGTETFTYDAVSRVHTRVDGRGVTQTYGYDALDRVVRVDYTAPAKQGLVMVPPDDGDATQVWINYSYDANGNLTARSDSNGNSGFTYDDLNRMTKETPESPSAVVTYTYDPAGNVTSVSAADEPTAVTYTFDSTNLVSSVKDQKGRTTGFGYDDKGNRTRTSLPNGVVQESRYDDSSRMTCTYAYSGSAPAGADTCPSASTSLLLFEKYAYDKLGTDTNRIQSREGRDGERTTYSYDAVSRLTGADTADATGATTSRHQYTYDSQGNLTRDVVSGSAETAGTRSQAYDVDNSLCWSADGDHPSDCAAVPAGATQYTYDDAGDLTAAGAMVAGYSLRGHMVQVDVPGMPTMSLKYTDATQDRRITAGDTRMAYNQMGLSSLGATNGSSSTWFPRDPDGKLVGMLRDGASDTYYLFDRLGSVAATTDEAGTVSHRYAYSPYGREVAPSAADANPWRFVAGFYDQATGMTKFGARYYLADTGQWTQRDPKMGRANDPMSLNTYGYAGCNPANNVDPSGRSWGDVYEFVGLMGDCLGGGVAASAAAEPFAIYAGAFGPEATAGVEIGAFLGGCVTGIISSAELGYNVWDFIEA